MLSAHSPRSANNQFEIDRQRFFSALSARNNPSIQIDGGALKPSVPQVAAPPIQRALRAPENPPEKFDMPAFLAQASNGDDGTGPQRQREFVASLISALGIQPNVFFALSGPAFGAAAAASEAFSRARRANQLLDTEMTTRDEEARLAVDNAYYALEGTLEASDSLNRQRLTDAFQDLDQNWSVLMLMPGGPYERLIVELIQALEPADAEGSLSPREHALLIATKQLRTAMLLNPRNSEAAWSQLGHALQAGQGQAHANTPPAGKPTLQ
jgi:hypothetical protein